MYKITFEDYKRAIKAQYEEKKRQDVTGILLNPTPAQLRNLCLMLFDNSLSNSDENTLELFFKVKESENLRKAIENCDISKFRPIQSFLRGEKDSGNGTRIELASILVDFNPRPYNKYMQNGGIENITNIEISPVEEQIDIFNGINDLEGFNNNEVITKDNKTIKKTAAFLMVLLSLFFMGYTIKDIVSPTKECMQWRVNHYEAVDCSNEKLGIGQFDIVVPIDEKIMELKKLDSRVALVFFKNGKPAVWYSKEDGKIELFNQPGFHPETEKQLRPITNYIIHKYKLKEKQ
jgi:hypothetical protein